MTLSAVAVLLAIFLFFYLSLRGVHILPTTILCTLIVGLSAEGGLVTSLYTTFSNAMGTFAGGVVIAFMSGGILGGLLQASGCSERFGRTVVSRFGVRFAPYALLVFVMIMAYCGITSYPFIAAILAFSLLRAANLPRNIGLIVIVGGATLTFYMFPGSVFIGNLLPTTVFGTTLYAGAGIGLVAFAIGTVLDVLYIEYSCRKYRKLGIGYTPTEMEDKIGTLKDENDLPGFFSAILPFAVVVALALIFQLVVGLDAYPSCAFAQLIAAALVLVMHWKRITEKTKAISEGVVMSCVPVLQVAMIYGFATVVSTTPIYNAVIGGVMNLQMSPYLLCVVGTMLLACISADAVAGIVMSSQMIGAKAMAMGANPALLHRLTVITGCTLDTMPYSSNLCVAMSFMGVNHKEGYFQCVVVGIGTTTVCALVAMVLCMVM
jgi:H+/gluconate symporter-like permease